MLEKEKESKNESKKRRKNQEIKEKERRTKAPMYIDALLATSSMHGNKTSTHMFHRTNFKQVQK